MKLVPGNWGFLYRESMVNVLSAIQTFVLSYGIVFPKKRHQAVSKDSGKTNYIERFNNTMRQRRSRLVKKTLSFSKKLSNHLAAIWYFIHEYNACLSSEQKA
jgi:IS1 family transposase